jgi:uncharacterized damage-inducible protein DinB
MSELLTLLREYADYNLWANKRFVDRLCGAPEALLDAEVVSSFPSLRKTVLHIRDAENAWMCRLDNMPVPWPAEDSFDLEGLLRTSQRLQRMVAMTRPDILLEERTYRTLKGDEQRSPVWRMLHHCFNHSTQHRGQLITMMRGLGMDRVPGTDLVLYQRTLTA